MASGLVRRGRRDDADQIGLFGGEHGGHAGIGVGDMILLADGAEAGLVEVNGRGQFDAVAQRFDGSQVIAN